MSSYSNTPSSILIVGSGVFGLSTLYELLNRPQYSKTKFTLLSPSLPLNQSAQGPLSSDISRESRDESARDLTASVDCNRIVRGDYSDPFYAALGREAQKLWRSEWGDDGRYSESGFVLTATHGTKAVDYIKKCLNTVSKSEDVAALEAVNSNAAISKAMRVPGVVNATGDIGYVNHRSGWANADASTAWLFRRILEASKKRPVSFVQRSAERLLPDQARSKIEGVQTSSGEAIHADLTILATGAWTHTQIDMTGIASARGQCMLYVDLSEDEAALLHNIPVHINMSTGCFLFPPTRRKDGSWEVKVARHWYGYNNPTEAPKYSLSTSERQHAHAHSLPTFPKTLPSADERTLLEFLTTAVPFLRSFEHEAKHPLGYRGTRGRMCWYLDTQSGDFLVCPHPSFAGTLFMATGGSGHAFKFLPALGRRIIDVLDGTDEAQNRGAWTAKWAWPEPAIDEEGDILPEVWCQDGSRSGEPGLVLADAFVSTATEHTRRETPSRQ